VKWEKRKGREKERKENGGRNSKQSHHPVEEGALPMATRARLWLCLPVLRQTYKEVTTEVYNYGEVLPRLIVLGI
jgi:hypothetical protein